ncbi:MAG: shikimate kinase [Magnetococcus sp. YQC-5]
MNIVLIGPRGVGKSRLARMLSILTKRPVLSTDLLISYEHQGLSIPALLQRHQGDWRVFREMEYAVVEKIAHLDDIIIDAGGGLVVDLDSTGAECFSHRKVAALKRHGVLVWLTGDLGRLARKVATDATRPLLSAQHAEETIMRRREPFYQQAADLTLNVEGRRVKSLAYLLLEQIVLVPEGEGG